MTPLLTTLMTNFVVTVCLMMCLWLLSLRMRNSSIVDPFWGTGFVVVAWISCTLNSALSGRSLMMAVLTTVWGSRLSLFLLWRSRGHGEDRRYASMRNHHGQRYWWVSLFTVFLLQSVLLAIVSLPLQVITVENRWDDSPNWLDYLGLLVWTVGFCFEVIGDWQLARFKLDPKNSGQVMKQGLWRYTRHPNYFGDFCIWWGIYLIALSAGGWWTVASPLVMSFLLMKVSGVALLESSINERRPDYAAYARQTNAFFPGRPRKS